MCPEAAPDFVSVLRRHCDMAETARFLIHLRIPVAIEKPCGISAAVLLVFRRSPFLDAIRAATASEAVQVASFKFIGGMVDRYREARCEWMLSRATAGGGALINAPLYPGFVADMLRCHDCGEPPVAGLADMAATMELAEAAYRASPLPPADIRSGKPAGSDAF
jgi:hypothetical protein